MDPFRIDTLSRWLTGRGSSRRALLRAVAAGIGVVGITAPAVEAKKKKCKGGLTRCGKKCVDLETNAQNCGQCKNSCAVDITCAGGVCQCLALDADCVTDGQCCSGKCSTEVISTCRKTNCVETGACGANSDCCGGFCVAGCCQGMC